MATYNCSDSGNASYGAGNFGACDATTGTVGAPNTGFFQQVVDGGSFTILAPLAVAIVAVIVSTLIIRKKRNKAANNA